MQDNAHQGFFLEKLLRVGEIEIAVCEGGHTCVGVYACKC